MLDFGDEAVGIDIGGYLVPRLYAAVITTNKTTYELPSESLKKLLTRL